jgi:short-subunit dehydrogenase
MPPHFARLNARFPRKRAFITGASSGLGLELARALAKSEWTLGLFDHDLERLTSVEGEITAMGVNVLAYPGDVTRADELTVAVNSFAGTYDGIDIMINNAGVAVSGALMQVPLEDWHWILDINVMGVVHGCRAALPHLQRNGTGAIVNVASAAAFVCAPQMSPYNASKAAVVAITETLAAELKNTGTQLSVVMPTFFHSNLLESLRGPEATRATAVKLMKQSGLSASQVAIELLGQVGAGKLHIVIPGSAGWLWRLKRWMPSAFVNLIAKRAEKSPAN